MRRLSLLAPKNLGRIFTIVIRRSNHDRTSVGLDLDVNLRTKVENLLKRRFFYDQSFAIYGGMNGLYDYGPMGCAMKANLLDEWRRHFVLDEQMLQVECATLTPQAVLVASGHVDRFVDLMVRDVLTGSFFRADHLVEAHMRQLLNKKLSNEQRKEIEECLKLADKMNADEIQAVITKYNIKAPETNNDLSRPEPYNLMFSTSIGPTGTMKGFLRPETSQGIFVNFNRLLEFNQGKLPFAVAQIGNSFRNEISPKSGLIRVREFTMAEIEHFVDPRDKSHRRFHEIENLEILLYSAKNQSANQLPEKMSIGQAVRMNIINNETLGYFIARIYQFLTKCGIKEDKLRFRQHMPSEMAHYACDCWDAECLTTYGFGWIECVGCADRSCYDLTQHTKHSGVKLVAERQLETPKQVEIAEIQLDKDSMSKHFRSEFKAIAAHFETLSIDELNEIEKKLSANEEEIEVQIDETKKFKVKKSHIKIIRRLKTIKIEEIVPAVIEPSFGIGRIMYAIWEHNYKERNAQRTYFALPAIIAPYKCSILPLGKNDEFKPFIKKLSQMLTQAGLSHKIDDNSGSIGRRYVRTDEIAIPYAITIDFDTLSGPPHTITLRERDSTQQIRVDINEITTLVTSLADMKITWLDAIKKYPIFGK